MSLSRQTLHRLPKIKEGLLTKQTYEQIAEKCGVHHRTIERDIRDWVTSGLFEVWIREEFLRLHPIIVSAYPEVAYREIARLVGKMVTQKHEVREELDIKEHIKIDMNVLSDDDKSILDRAARLLESKGAKRSSDLH